MQTEEFDDLPVALFTHVARTLFGPDADAIVKQYEEGWLGYFPGDALSLGLAAVSPQSAKRLISFKPELADRVREMRANPEAALEKLAEELRSDSDE